MFIAVIQEEERGPAILAEAALIALRAEKSCRFAAGPREIIPTNADQRRKEIAECFRAHPATAQMRIVSKTLRAEPDGAALAAAGPQRVIEFGHETKPQYTPKI
ncbi:hypothetical protein V0U79_01950 [Hyphobacterium sp. HN65]|uniref:Uncharacterized protein n=1 Tax=Hyphobacterium lacteum TaxID=3116575 RepID=A0ABU7LMG1_9PROT|nr:hypothetical protein [Hyphobacterium sp. HN65]MEE2525111.1 hypothetical protein [Hyphobacterium sp. HN65]